MSTHQICSFCGSNKIEILFQGSDLLYESPGKYSLFKCDNCGVIFLNPQPSNDALEEIYPTTYHAFPTAIEEEKSLLRRIDRKRAINRKCQFVIQCTRLSGKILDVGCSTGLFLDGMRAKGWEVFGVEPSTFASNYAQNYFGLDVQNCSFEEASFSDNQFDVVTFWDVAEHLSDPYGAFQKAARILKPEGYILLNVPNPESFERYIFKESWVGWDLPRHFFIFSSEALSNMLKNAGFGSPKIHSITGFHGAMLISFKMFFTRHSTPHYLSKPILWFLNLLPIRVLSIPLFRIIAHYNRSSFYTAVAKKMGADEKSS